MYAKCIECRIGKQQQQIKLWNFEKEDEKMHEVHVINESDDKWFIIINSINACSFRFVSSKFMEFESVSFLNSQFFEFFISLCIH